MVHQPSHALNVVQQPRGIRRGACAQHAFTRWHGHFAAAKLRARVALRTLPLSVLLMWLSFAQLAQAHAIVEASEDAVAVAQEMPRAQSAASGPWHFCQSDDESSQWEPAALESDDTELDSRFDALPQDRTSHVARPLAGAKTAPHLATVFGLVGSSIAPALPRGPPSSRR